MAYTRRDLLGRGGLMALSAAAWPRWMPRMVFRREDAAPSGDILVVVFMRGACDGLNLVIPYGDEAEYFRRRPSIGIPAPDANVPDGQKAMDLDGFFGMHPVMARADQGNWKQWWDAGVMAVVHAMHMDDTTRSHFDAMDFMERGTPGEKRVNTGWLGRHLELMSGTGSPFRAVGIGNYLQASLRGPIPAAALQSIAEFHLNGRQSEIAQFQARLQSLYGGEGWLDGEGQATFAALELLQTGLGGDEYTPEHGARYGDNGFSRGLKQIAQLIKADVGLEVACVDIGGWDTHAGQVTPGTPAAGRMAQLADWLSNGITAFMTDLQPNFIGGAEPRVTIVTMSEFGRRATENGGNGTDHGHGNLMFLFGAGINGGEVYTNPWPGLRDEDLYRGDLAGTSEYRDVLGEILAKRLGNTQIDQVFPNHAFEFHGVAKEREFEPPTPGPSPTPGATATPAGPNSRIYLPWSRTGE
ncbi:MAG: DUF1501 domain-containing protein [Anaerolineae bacterium]